MITAGIDAGSRAIKAVLWESETGRLLATAITDQGVAQAELARDIYQNLLQTAAVDPSRVARVVATGYGRNLVDFATTTITEITCHARGVRFLAPDVRTIIEIGGQDSKLIRLTASGAVRDFAMNDRCAAGTGRFLEVVASRLQIPLADLSALAEKSRKPAAISSMCVVFAETEIIGLLAGGTPPEDIVAGIHSAVATRVAAMAGRHVDSPIYFTGGVALIPRMAHALSEILGQPILTVEQPCFTGALGAAVLAASQELVGKP